MNTNVISSTAELEKKYQTLKKDKEILQNKNQLYRRNVYIFSLGALFLAGLAVAFSIFRHRKKNEKIKIQKEILHQQDLATKAVITAEDNERKRMATHLHDGVGQLLMAANMNVSVLNEYKDNPENFKNITQKIASILSDAIADVRTLSHQMMPNMLIKNSLANALRDLIEKTSTPKLAVNLQIEGLENEIDQNIQVTLYRIIQECINNTVKHSGADKIDISVIQSDKKITTEIKDNGKGFNPLKITENKDGIGLQNMKARIEMLKGKMRIDSAADRGTQVFIEIPIV